MWSIFAVFNIIVSTYIISATIDMNIHELQFVADHLTVKECRKLEAALQQKTFQLDLKQLDQNYKKTKLTENTPCLVRLINWDRGLGRKNTFHDLAIRLKELGFIELSDKLSRNVYHEKANAVQTQFVNDPFKKLIPKKSILLDEPKERRRIKMKPAPLEEEQTTFNTVMWTTFGAISVVATIFVGFYVCCPDVFCLIWHKVAPEGCVVGCDLIIGEGGVCCKKFGKHTNKYLLGKRKFRKLKVEEIEVPFDPQLLIANLHNIQ